MSPVDRQAAALDRLRQRGLGLAPHMVDGKISPKRSSSRTASRAQGGRVASLTPLDGESPHLLNSDALERLPAVHELWIPAPGKFLSLNDRMHHHPKARLVKAWRQAARTAAARANLPQGLARVHVDIAVVKTSRRAYDVHNLMPTAKACIDGIVVDYGLCADDSNDYLTGPDMRPGGTAEWAGLKVTIKQVA